jgi:hypothetical protein
MPNKAIRNSLLLFIFLSSLPIFGEVFTCSGTLAGSRGQVLHALTVFSTYGQRFVVKADGTETWPIDGTHQIKDGLKAYNSFFADVMAGKTLEHWATDRRREGKASHVLDLFGSCLFSKAPWAFDSLTGARVRTISAQQIAPEYARLNWREIIGDLFERATWNQLDGDARSREISAYDLIIIRPYGPLEKVSNETIQTPQQIGFYGAANALLDRAWQRLSASEGTMLIETWPIIVRAPEYRAWLARLKSANVEYVEGRRSLRLIKRRDSPEQLPK